MLLAVEPDMLERHPHKIAHRIRRARRHHIVSRQTDGSARKRFQRPRIYCETAPTPMRATSKIWTERKAPGRQRRLGLILTLFDTTDPSAVWMITTDRCFVRRCQANS